MILAMDIEPDRSRRNSTITGIVCAIVVVVPLAYLSVRLATQFDFLPYWISARLLAEGHNPYDRAAIFHIEKALGNREVAPFIMRNPPWALPLVAPLGDFSVHWAALLWFLWMLLLAMLSVWFLTRDHPAARPRAALFAPLLIALLLGQLATVVLFVSAFFLAFWRRRPFVAGVVLSVAAIKAHLLVLFWPVLLLDCYRRRDWRIPAGLLIGVASLTGLAFLLDPHGWAQYRHAMLHESLTFQYLPNVSADIRFLLLRRQPWFQLVPSVLGLGAALWCYMRRYWNWTEDGAILLAVSTLLSPYCWSCDMALILPAVLQVRAGRRAQDLYFLCCIVSFLMALLVHSWASPWLSLLGPLWIGWYVVARRLSQRNPPPTPRAQSQPA
jgi:hypothetical protein